MLVVLRIDGRGTVLDVKDSKFGPASRYESEPPFVIILPEAGAVAGQSWERAYQITLDPPQGTGKKFEAAQKYLCKVVEGGAATVTLTTTVKTLPEAVADQAPLLQMQPEGEIVFDTQTGLVQRPTANRQGAEGPPGRGEQLSVPEQVHGGVRRG